MTERTATTRPPEADPAAAEPFLRVTHGNPTAEELAVLVAVLLEVAASQDERAVRQPRSPWADPGAVLRQPRR